MSSVKCSCLPIVDSGTAVALASPFEPRLWAIEGATGHGALLAQQLVASGETVVDVPAALSARARLLHSGRKDKTDAPPGMTRPAPPWSARHNAMSTDADDRAFD